MSRLRATLARSWPFGRDSDEGSEADAGAGGVWDAIPSWQYDGRFVEAGGITRGEQERALSELQSRADREEEVPDHRE